MTELRVLIGEDLCAAFKEAIQSGADTKAALREVFSALMKQDSSLVAEQLQSLVSRFQSSTDACPTLTGTQSNLDLGALVLRLSQQYPDDVGVFCPFFLNILSLMPGEAIFLAANEPHAYLDGDIIECMACSDNVVRAGKLNV